MSSVVGGDGDFASWRRATTAKTFIGTSRRAAASKKFSVSAAGLTMYDKIVRDHTIATEDNGTKLLFIDRHMVHEVTRRKRSRLCV